MMKKNTIMVIGAVCILVIAASVITLNWNADNSNSITDDITADDSTNTPSNSDTTTDDTPTATEPDTTNDNIDDDSNTTPDTSSDTDQSSSSSTSEFSSTSVAEALADNKDDHDDNDDYLWDSSDVIAVTLNTNSISVADETGVIIDGTTLTITSAGTYSISGTLNDGQIIVDTSDEDVVRLILNDATISSTTNAPIYVANADKTVIVLADGTQNYLTDNKNNQENSTILSKDDLTICGDGSLTVTANTNNGIESNDGLVIKSGTITVTSVDDGILGKDYLVIKGGDITINSVGDGLKSSNDEEQDKGYIYIEDGTITITSTQGDAITAQTDLLIAGGTFTLTSGGGSSAYATDLLSTKGLKSAVNIVIDGGDFTISSSDDAIHSNDLIIINSGTFDISTGDDGIHADTSLEINGGTFDITKSYEGLESALITVNNGNIQIVSSDDGINIAGGNDNSGFDGRARQDMFSTSSSDTYYLYINGGVIVIDSGGDGIDSNGYIEMNDGVVIINGPTSSMNGALDYLGSFKITGGILVAVGSSGMAQAPSSVSTQYSIGVIFSTTQSANTLVSIQTASGEELLTFKPTKTYQSIVFSSSELGTGSYTIYLGGSSTGTLSNGIYENGTYSPGTQYTTFTTSGVVTTVGSTSRRR
ncbi:MAG: carbohydrate-binding domain-containing protein [Candidatus Bathyarchaeota archaeon]|nr:carbohydrate-binding domain-containing protein [Candidatus Bathyarchaeum sp.]